MSYHNALVAKLRRKGGWIIESTSTQIIMSKALGKKIGSRVVSVMLERTRSPGMYVLRPFGYEFHSTTSHYDYRGDRELRWTRDKGVFKSVIKILKAVGGWECIENQNFLKVNDLNKRSKKDKLSLDLNHLMKV